MKKHIDWNNKKQVNKYFREYHKKRRKLLGIKENINQKDNRIKKCTKCGTILNRANWTRSWDRKARNYVCDTCQRIYDVNYNRKHYLDTSREGKKLFLKGVKRDRPTDNKCELCKTQHKYLGYHHWDDSDISKGIWCCWFCHGLVELIDRGFKILHLVKSYLNFKEKI